MKTNVKVFDEILSKILVGGCGDINQAKLDFGKKSIEGLLRNESASLQLRIIIQSKIFDGYKAQGEIGIMDLGLFKQLLNRHGGEVEFEFTKDKLVLEDIGKKSNIALSDVKYIRSLEKYNPVEDVEWDEEFSLDALVLKSFISDMKIVKETKIHINTKKGGLILSAGEMDSISSAVQNKELKGGCSVVFDDVFLDTISVFKDMDTISIYLKKDFPAYIVFKNDLYSLEYLISPMVADED